MNVEPPARDDGANESTHADAQSRPQSSDESVQAESHTTPRTAVNPLTAAQVDAAFAEIATALRHGDGEAFTALPRAKKPQLAVVEAPENLVVDPELGIVSDPKLALCQMCLTGLVDVRTRRVCAHCVSVDRLLAKQFQAARFLPTTRRFGTVNRCQMVRTLVPQVSRTPADTRMHRTLERELWHQMQQLFESNLRLLVRLRELPTGQPMAYTDWAHDHSPSITRSLDAYLAYTLVHAPWARTHVEQLIIENEGKLA